MTNKNSMTKKTHGAVIYTRVSTGEQDKHGTSPETQLASCRQKALALNLPIVAEYYDGGVSGSFLVARPGMQSALADLTAGRADTLICANITRYSRDTEHQQAIKKAVQNGGGRLVFCDMDFEDTAAGDLNFDIQGSFAAYERKVIRERTASGRTTKARGGIQPSRRTSPFGYHIVTHTDVLRGEQSFADVGRYLVVDAQAGAVRRIYSAYHTGVRSLTGLARELTQQGIPTPGKAPDWCATTIHYILSNPVYKGMAVYGRFDNFTDESRLTERHWHTGEMLKEPRFRRKADPDTWITMDCPPLVTEDVWDAVQMRLKANKAKKGGNPQRVRMLAGRILCPHCGSGLICGSEKIQTRRGRTTTVPRRFCCGVYMRSMDKRNSSECLPTNYLVSEVEGDVLAAIVDAAHRPEAIAEAITAAMAAYAAAPAVEDALAARKEIASIDKALEDLSRQEAATVQAQITGIMQGAPPEAYAAAFADMAVRRKDMEDQRGSLSRRVQSTQPAPEKMTPEKRGDTAETQADALRLALEDAVRVLASDAVPGQVKRDAIGHLIESVVPSRAVAGKRASAKSGTGLTTTVSFLPGVLAEVVQVSGIQVPDTMQTIRLGSESIRALFSAISALSWAANGEIRRRLPPPRGLEKKLAVDPT